MTDRAQRTAARLARWGITPQAHNTPEEAAALRDFCERMIADAEQGRGGFRPQQDRRTSKRRMAEARKRGRL